MTLRSQICKKINTQPQKKGVSLRLVDPQGARWRMMIDYGKLIEIFDSIINEQVQLRASSEGSKASNDVLGSFLHLAEEDNLEISCNDFKHLLLVIDYFLTFEHIIIFFFSFFF